MWSRFESDGQWPLGENKIELSDMVQLLYVCMYLSLCVCVCICSRSQQIDSLLHLVLLVLGVSSSFYVFKDLGSSTCYRGDGRLNFRLYLLNEKNRCRYCYNRFLFLNPIKSISFSYELTFFPIYWNFILFIFFVKILIGPRRWITIIRIDHVELWLRKIN